MKLLDGELEQVARLARELSGIVLEGDKGYLIESRLSALAELATCSSFGMLCDRIRAGLDRDLASGFIDGITTGETRFFRDLTLFDAIEHKFLPDAFDCAQGKRPVRVLSAACSTGHEPSSVAMVACDLFGDSAAINLEITGVDISPAALDHARCGLFTDFDLKRSGCPERSTRYLLPDNGGWRLKPQAHGLVDYREHNLLKGLSGFGKFDLILCRNVAIYFDVPTREKLVFDLLSALHPGGILAVGSAETISFAEGDLIREEHCGAIVYRRPLAD